MGRLKVDAAGGFPAILYTFKKAMEAGGLFRFFTRMASKNACKTCALGMGGQKGGMVNEAGHFPEFCKKSVQAQAGDMTGVITERFLQENTLENMRYLTPAQLEKLGRVAFPMMAGPHDTHYRRITWEEAMAKTAQGFAGTRPDRVFFYASGRASNEAAFLLQLVARAYGTANLHNCSFYCHQASGVALNKVYGSGTSSIVLDDLDEADLAVVVGANPASNHPRLVTKLVEMRGRGGKVIVINPVKELGLQRFRIPSKVTSLIFGSTVSDLYLQPKVGSDIALFKAILKGLLEAGKVDNAYIDAYTTGWDAVKADTETTDWQTLLSACGLTRPQVDQAVAIIGKARRGILMWAMGLTHHAHGVDNILALSNIALSRGWLGRAGCGLLPIRGHSNVQGVGSMGVAPNVKEAFAQKLEALYGINVPREPGQDTYASMQAAERGEIDAALMLGGNLYSSNPDSLWAEKALETIPLIVYATTKLNEGHFHGRGRTTIILPVLARDEEPQWTTQESMFNYVRLSEGGTPAVPGEMRSEVEIIADLAQRILPDKGLNWSDLRSHQKLREAMAQVVPGMAEVAEIDKTQGEFQIPGRTFHQPQFATEDGKARFHAVTLPTLPEGEFMLMTLRSEGQFNTVVYEEEDLYRGNTRRDVVMMSLQDARCLGLDEGDPVMVQTRAGKMPVVVSITDIAPGSLAMYYPEANVLVTQVIDPQSKTPAFKSIPASVVPIKAREPLAGRR